MLYNEIQAQRKMQNKQGLQHQAPGSPKILWLKLMVFDASDDRGALFQVGGKYATDTVLVVVEAVPRNLHLHRGSEAFETRNGLPRLKIKANVLTAATIILQVTTLISPPSFSAQLQVKQRSLFCMEIKTFHESTLYTMSLGQFK